MENHKNFFLYEREREGEKLVFSCWLSLPWLKKKNLIRETGVVVAVKAVAVVAVVAFAVAAVAQEVE